MKRLAIGLALAGLAAFLLTASLVAEEKVKLEGVKCPVSNRDAVDKDGTSLEYKGARVYFCCANCPNAFKNDKAKFSTKANAQLVQTGQAEQVKCPIAGRDINKATEIKVADIKVAFCCNNCKGKVEKAEGDEQLTLVFEDKAFEKGFKVKAKKEE